jgi:hypothetical protein
MVSSTVVVQINTVNSELRTMKSTIKKKVVARMTEKTKKRKRRQI